MLDRGKPIVKHPSTASSGAFNPRECGREPRGRDIQQGLIDYVANFATVAAGKKFNPHVTIGVATEAYLKERLAEPFKAFTFSPAGASIYQLGSFGKARKELRGLSVMPWAQ
jgi:hypothetical protein